MNAFLHLAEQQIAAPRKRALRAAETLAEKQPSEHEQLGRLWHQWQAERRAALLAGPHGSPAAELVAFLDSMTTADGAELVAMVQRWRSADPDTRFEILVLVDRAIVALHERAGLPPFDDPLPGEPATVFLVIRETLA